MPRTIVLSGINLFEAGPLMIARDFLEALRRSPAFGRGELKVIFFCHTAALYADLAHPAIELVEKPPRGSYLRRFFHEYVWFWFWSRRRDVDTWVSLHDVTPNVRARHRFLYCHNATPMYEGKRRWRDEPRFELFRSVYAWLYRINIRKNELVIVQQQWIRDYFIRTFGCDAGRVAVARPSVEVPEGRTTAPTPPGPTTLVYPALPRFFKNFEVLFEAMRILRDEPVRLEVTISGEETRYARSLIDRFGRLPNVDYLGYIPRQEVMKLYESADALVFPSTLESWGLPLSEFRAYGKPVFAAALPYAYETLSGYPHAAFFDPHDADALARTLRAFIRERRFEAAPVTVEYAPPLARNWPELLQIIGLW